MWIMYVMMKLSMWWHIVYNKPHGGEAYLRWAFIYVDVWCDENLQVVDTENMEEFKNIGRL